MMKRALLILATVAVPGLASAQIQVRLTVPEIRVRVAPPPPRTEIRPPSQGPDRTWIGGHWARRDNSTVWIAGVWTRPPREGMTWEQERWAQHDGSWYFTDGHWRIANANPSEVYQPREVREDVETERRPPRNVEERRPEVPFRGAVWINGYWGWNGSDHDWVAGHWSARQRDSVWTPDRWQRTGGKGPKGRWALVPGRWQHR